MAGPRLYHNHVRWHLGMPGDQTSDETAGICTEGDSKWKTLIQVATKQKSDD